MKHQLISICVVSLLAITAYGQAKTLDEVQELDLQTAQQIALADNPSLAAAAERVEQARQRIEQARALYWPSVDAGGSARHNRMSGNAADLQSMLLGGQDINQNSENYRLSLAASWLLFDGFSRKFSINKYLEHCLGLNGHHVAPAVNQVGVFRVSIDPPLITHRSSEYGANCKIRVDMMVFAS